MALGMTPEIHGRWESGEGGRSEGVENIEDTMGFLVLGTKTFIGHYGRAVRRDWRKGQELKQEVVECRITPFEDI